MDGNFWKGVIVAIPISLILWMLIIMLVEAVL